MITYLFVPLFSAWVASVIKVAVGGPSLDLLSQLAFFWIFGMLTVGPMLVMSPRTASPLISSRAEPIVFVLLSIAAATGLALYFAAQVGVVFLFLLVGPLCQYLIFRGGIRRFKRRNSRSPVEPTPIAVLYIFTFPKGTPFADRAYLAGMWFLSWVPFVGAIITAG